MSKLNTLCAKIDDIKAKTSDIHDYIDGVKLVLNCMRQEPKHSLQPKAV